MTATALDLRPEAATDRELPLRFFNRPEAGSRGQDPDWAGLWFDLVEELSGEFVGMRGGRRGASGEISWTFVPHASYDGLGGFVHLLRQETGSADITIPSRKSRKPSWLARAMALARLVAKKPRAAAAWKGLDPSWRQDAGGPRAGTVVATEFWAVDRTRRLAANARAQGVPVNSLLLSALARASQSELHSGPAIWMMPVNMRGPVALSRDTANHTGYLQIELGRDATPAQAHEQVKEGLRRREQWASWLFLNAGRLVGYAGMRRIYQFQMPRFGWRPFVGAFSNLGSWDGYGDWFVCPPVTLTSPVGAGVITCNGRLSLTLEAHPSIARDPAWAGALMDRWVAELGV